MPMLGTSPTSRSIIPSLGTSASVVATPATVTAHSTSSVSPEVTPTTFVSSTGAGGTYSKPRLTHTLTSSSAVSYRPRVSVTSEVTSFTSGITHVSSPHSVTTASEHSPLVPIHSIAGSPPVASSIPAGVIATAHPQPTLCMMPNSRSVTSYAALPTTMTHLPTIPSFSGRDGGDDEVFEEWLEQFEAVASLAGWNEHAKLVNLTARLRGVAYSFFRSCTPEQRSSYSLLVEQMKKRFTPVQLTAIQTQLFHDRVQNNKESVDDYAQALRKLFKKSYSSLLRGQPESGPMAQMVLVSQFVSGLRPYLKAKVVGTEGNLDQLLVKARFEEAKSRELAQARGGQTPKKPQENPSSKNLAKDTSPKPGASKGDWKEKTCHNSSLKGHLIRFCPYPPTKGDREAGGKKPQPSTKCMIPDQPSNDDVDELRHKLHEAELANAVTDAANVIGTVTFEKDQEGKVLGPSITSTVCVNGQSTNALVDTGSPVSIISLDFAMVVMARERKSYQTVGDWREATLKKFEPPGISLKSYCGSPLDILARLPVRITRGPFEVGVTVLVQKGAPSPLLLGTNALHPLGQCLVEKEAPAKDAIAPADTALSIPPTTSDSSFAPEPKSTRDCTPSSKTAVVSLLNATRIPAGYQKTVQAVVKGEVARQLALFTPQLTQVNICAADGVVDLTDGTCFTLFLQNHGTEAVKLKKGSMIGEVVPAEEIPPDTPEAVVHSLAPELEGGDVTHTREERLLGQLDLHLDHLSPSEQSQLKELILSYADVFALDTTELGTTEVVQHIIDTGGSPPIKQPLRRTPFALRTQVDEMVQEMLAQNIITPSKSPWASPIVLVRKKDGRLRFCVDYRKLNSVTKLDEFPLPRIDNTLDQLAGVKFFTTLDMASGYWLVEMSLQDQEKTAFRTYFGLYEFRKMPFGLVNAPATFQRLMEVVLSDLVREACLIYLNDVLVMGKTLEEHNQNLRKVLEKFRGAGLRLKPKKCFFAKLQVEYLGHVVSAKGTRADPKKTKAVQE